MFSGKSGIDVSKVDAFAIQTANKQDGNIADHVFGKADSKVTLIEYGDYQCPACGSVHVTIRDITEQYKDKLRFVFRNFPLTAIHPNGKAAAAVVEAAGLQGKFWEMHNKVYESQSSWSDLSISDRGNFFDGYAKGLGLKVSTFQTDTASKSVEDKIAYDTALGNKVGVDATPTFYLNKTKLEISMTSSKEKMKEVIDAALVKAGISLQ
jgi:protein-disulfide isomerase